MSGEEKTCTLRWGLNTGKESSNGCCWLEETVEDSQVPDEREDEAEESHEDDLPDNLTKLGRNRQGMSRLREVTNTVVSLNCREREFDRSCGEKKLDEV